MKLSVIKQRRQSMALQFTPGGMRVLELAPFRWTQFASGRQQFKLQRTVIVKGRMSA